MKVFFWGNEMYWFRAFGLHTKCKALCKLDPLDELYIYKGIWITLFHVKADKTSNLVSALLYKKREHQKERNFPVNPYFIHPVIFN